MKQSVLGCWIVTAVATALVGCNQAKTPEQVSQDAAAAQQKADTEVAKTEQSANDQIAGAKADVRQEQQDASHTVAVQDEKVALVKADGDHKVALANCEAVGGKDQQTCKDRADAAYETAKAEAKQIKADSDPKP